eukprot:8514766-Pyramimonas_sp.AAC.1
MRSARLIRCDPGVLCGVVKALAIVDCHTQLTDGCCWQQVPETKGRTLEQIEAYFAEIAARSNRVGRSDSGDSSWS